jgi:hypothetical protein
VNIVQQAVRRLERLEALDKEARGVVRDTRRRLNVPRARSGWDPLGPPFRV